MSLRQIIWVGRQIQTKLTNVSLAIILSFSGLAGSAPLFLAQKAYAASPTDIVINEIFPATGSANKWVELYNKAAEPLDISNWRLYRNSSNWSTVFTSGTTISGHGFIYFESTSASLPLSSGGSPIELWTGPVSTGMQIDSVDWGSLTAGQTYGRTTDGNTAFQVFSTPTQGWENNNYYVSSGGSDVSGTGSQASPFATITKGLSVLQSGGTLILQSDLTLSTAVLINKPLTLDGAGFTLNSNFAKTSNSNNAGIIILDSGVTIKNLTINGSGGTSLHGINIYQSTGVVLSNVALNDNDNAALIVNGSEVSASSFNTNGNGWGAVNIDPGSGVAMPSVFTLNSGSLDEVNQIWSDGANVSGSATVTVNASGYSMYKLAGTSAGFIWTNRTLTNAATITRDGITTLYSTIQDAINAASTTLSEVINVASGTYTTTGQVVIDKSLTIVGASDKPMIQPDADLPHTNNATGAWFLVDAGVTFNLESVVLDGNGKKLQQGVRSHGTTMINNVDFKNILNSTSPYVGFAIANFGGTVPGGAGSDTHGSGGALGTLSVTNSTFTNIGRIGVLTKGTGSTATLDGNTYTGKGDGTFLDYAFEFGAGGSGTVSGNTISDNRGVASDTSTSAGILVTEYYGSGTNATITGNTFSNNSAGLHVGYLDNDTSTVTAHENDFSGETIGVISTTTAVTVNAGDNWWGNALGPNTTQYTGNVNVSSWCSVSDCSSTQSASSGITALPSGPIAMPTISGDTASITLPDTNSVTASTMTSSGAAQITVPAGTTVTASSLSWDGTIAPPSVSTVPAGSVIPGTLGTVIEVGSSTVGLSFDQPVRLSIPRQAGQRVGFIPAGSTTFTEIITPCGFDNLAVVTAGFGLGANECKIDVGGDLIVWTNHFTKFVTYTQAAAPSSTTASGIVAGSSTTAGGTFTPSFFSTAANNVLGSSSNETKTSGTNTEAETPSVAQTSPVKPNSGKLLGLIWYWWLVILLLAGAALYGIYRMADAERR